MNSITLFIIFIPLLSFVLLIINFFLATHKPNKDKDSQFECGFTSFVQMSRMAFTISFFIYGLLFLLFDLEILLVYPYVISSYNNDIYGLIIMILFFLLLTVGFVYEIGNKALQIDTRQTLDLFRSSRLHNINKQSKHFNLNMKWFSRLKNKMLKVYYKCSTSVRRTPSFFTYNLKNIIKQSKFFNLKTKWLFNKILEVYNKCYGRIYIRIVNLPYRVILVSIALFIFRFFTNQPLSLYFKSNNMPWLMYLYIFFFGIFSIFIVYKAQNIKVSCSDCVELQIDRLTRATKVGLFFWLLSIIFPPFQIPFQCQSWEFTPEAGQQLKRGYVHPSEKMKICNILNYPEGSSPNQPVGREIIMNLHRANYRLRGWTYNNPNLPEEVRVWLAQHLKFNYPEQYRNAIRNGEFRFSVPRITESLVRDIRDGK